MRKINFLMLPLMKMGSNLMEDHLGYIYLKLTWTYISTQLYFFVSIWLGTQFKLHGKDYNIRNKKENYMEKCLNMIINNNRSTLFFLIKKIFKVYETNYTMKLRKLQTN